MDGVRGDGKRINDNYKGALFRNTIHEKVLQDAKTGKKDAEAKSAALQSELHSLETALQAVESEREAAESENSSLKTRIDKLNKRVESFSRCHSPALEAQNTALRLRVGELESIITDGMQKNKTLIKKLEGAETRANNALTNNNYKLRMQDAEQQAQNLRKEKENAESEIKDLQRKLNGTSWQSGVRLEEKTALENKYKTLESRAQNVFNNNSNLQRRVQDTETQLRTLREAKDNADNEIEELQKKLNGSSWQAGFCTRSDEKTALENKNIALENRVQSILNEKNNLQWRVMNAEAQFQKARDQKDNAESEIRDLKKKLNGTSWQASFRIEEKTALENQNKALESRAQTIFNNNNSLQRRVQEAEKQIQNLQDQKREADTEIKDLNKKLNGTSWQASFRMDEKIALENKNQALESFLRQAKSSLQNAKAELQLLRDQKERHECAALIAAEDREAERAAYKSFHEQQQKELKRVEQAAFERFVANYKAEQQEKLAYLGWA